MISFFGHPHTTWTNIKKEIEIDIINGRYKESDRIPSVRALSSMFSTSPVTVEKAVKSMTDEETIFLKKGKGYFVKPFIREVLLKKHKSEMLSFVEEALHLNSQLDTPMEELVVNFLLKAMEMSNDKDELVSIIEDIVSKLGKKNESGEAFNINGIVGNEEA